MTTRYLLDNSVIQRLRNPIVREAVFDLDNDGVMATCLPVALEQGFSARGAGDHERLLDRIRSDMITLEPEPAMWGIAVGIQSALFRVGMGRSVGVSDLQIAATAVHHSTELHPVVLVHYDRDFDHVSAVEPRLRSRWIVPPGSVA